jgi:hypothetical protein
MAFESSSAKLAPGLGAVIEAVKQVSLGRDGVR